MKTKSSMSIYLLLSVWLVGTGVARAAAVSWTNTNGGLWSAPTNWSPNTVPTANDDAVITAAGTYSVTQDIYVVIASLTLGGASGQQSLTNSGAVLTISTNSEVTPNGVLAFAGTFNGSGSLTVSGKYIWTAGNLRVPMTVTPAGVVELSSGADKGMTGTLVNQGTITVAGTGKLFFDPTILDIRPGALLDFQSDGSLVYYSGAPYVTNAGTIRKSAGPGTTIFDGVPLRNTGLIEAQTGMISFSATGCRFDSGTQFKGSGTNALSGGVITLHGPISSQNLVLAGATIIGTNTLSGAVQWTAGNIEAQGVVTVAAGSTLSIVGPAVKGLVGILNNDGLVTWSGGGDLHLASAMINNRPGAVFDAMKDGLIHWPNGNQPLFTNAGTFRKSAGTGTTTFNGVSFRNSGVVDAQVGAIVFNTTGTSFENGTQFLGAGTNLLAGGQLTLNGSIYSQNLEFGGAGILGTNTLTGTVRWTAGNIEAAGNVTVGAGSTFNLAGPAVKGSYGVLNNDGLITWSGGGDLHLASAMIHNRPGGVFEAMKDGTIHWPVGNQPIFTNAGTFRKNAGTGTITFSGVVFRNSGVVDAQVGTIVFNTTGTTFESGTQFLGAGTNLLAGGYITLNGVIDSQNLEFGGAVILGTNTLTGTVRWTAGNIEAAGNVTVAATSTLNLVGPAVKGLVGILNNDGLVSWSGGGDLHLASAVIHNRPGGVFDAMKDGTIHWPGGTQPVFTNAGTFRKSAGTGTTTINGVVFRNAGVVDAQGGAIVFNTTGTLFNDGTQFVGAGTNLLDGGTITLNGAIHSENLECRNAIITGTNALSGTVTWTGNYIDGAGAVTVATNGVLNLTGAAAKGVVGVLRNRGTISLFGGGILVMGSLTPVVATIHNDIGGLFNVSSDNSIVWTVGSQPVFTNAGTFRKTLGTNLTDFSGVPFHNTGMVDVHSGIVRFLSTYSQTGGRLQFGLTSVTNFGQAQFAQAAPLTGTLGVNLLGGFKPRAGDAFAIISYYPTYTGGFDAFDLPTAAAWQTNSSIYGANAVTLTVLNARPTLDPISDQTGDEQTAITFSATASDPDVIQTAGFSLLDAPAGATINPNTGVFTWTPTEAQGPSTNLFAVSVGDNGTPTLTHTQSVTVIVNEVNRAPVATSLTLAPVNELAPFLLATNLATDPDLPTNMLSFALIDPPGGALIDDVTGVITWTPSEAQGPSSNAISVRITDSGSPPLSATNTLTLIVAEVNMAPSLAPLPNLTHVVGAVRWVTNSASDADLPPNQLLFSLVNPPPGMSISPTTGVLVWQPPADGAPLTNAVIVRVTDNGSPALTNEQTFVATLIPVPRLSIAPAGLDHVVLSWPAAATDAGFVLTARTNLLSPGAWEYVSVMPTVIAGENVLTNDASAGFRAYRLRLPALP